MSRKTIVKVMAVLAPAADVRALAPGDLEAVAQRLTPRWWCGETSSVVESRAHRRLCRPRAVASIAP